MIALASKELPADCDYHLMPRHFIESELEFLGILVLENRLKLGSVDVIRSLKSVAMRQVMITGDNLNTALSVAKQSAMIEVAERVIIIEVVPSKSADDKPKVSFKTMPDDAAFPPTDRLDDLRTLPGRIMDFNFF